MPMTQANGIDIHYELDGDGDETIVMINGLADDLETWVLQMEDFLGHAVPSPEFEITYGERREHCFTGDTEHPNNVGSRTVHQRYMPAMAQWMMKTAPAGADTRSWVY